jgi:hypothetical protein
MLASSMTGVHYATVRDRFVEKKFDEIECVKHKGRPQPEHRKQKPWSGQVVAQGGVFVCVRLYMHWLGSP